MYKRIPYDALEQHLTKKQVTAITGMRRVGKTTAIQYLLDKVAHENKIYLDLERIEYRHLFNQPSYADIERGLIQLGIDFTTPAVIALDEIQLVKNIPSVIKSLYDTYQVKFIVSGSSSFYIKNHFAESLAGRKKIFEMSKISYERRRIMEVNPDAILWDGFDEAIVGISEDNRAVYNIYMMESIMWRDNKKYITFEEASEWVQYNILQAYLGDETPIHIWVMPTEEEEEWK